MAQERHIGYRYDDLRVGMAFRSPGRTITEADLVGFAGLTGDFSELHTSEVYGKASQFGRRVAHGMLGLAYAHGLMWARTGELRDSKSRPTQAIATFDVSIVDQDDRVVQRGKKALLVSKVALQAVAASAASPKTGIPTQ